MKRRSLRNLLSAGMLVAFALLAMGTQPPPSPRLYGEKVQQLYVSYDAAYVLTSHEDSPGDKNSRLRFSRITSYGEVALLQDVPLHLHASHWSIATAVNQGNDGLFAFALVDAGGGDPFTVVISAKEKPLITPLVLQGRAMAGGGDVIDLAILARDSDRYWVYPKQSGSMVERDLLPLFEIGDGVPELLADNVVWADCVAGECRQIRMEDNMVRLYANAAGADSFSVVTETTNVSGSSASGHFACNDTDGTPAIVIGETMYIMPITYPAVVTQGVRLYGGACGTPPTFGHREASAEGYFRGGRRIVLESLPKGGASTDSCEDDCPPVRMILYVRIYESDGVLRESFPLSSRH